MATTVSLVSAASAAKRRHVSAKSWSRAAPHARGGGKAAAAVRRVARAGVEASNLINEGLKLFKEGKNSEALQRFDSALGKQLTLEEEQAAWYNRACALCAEGELANASESLEKALDKGVSFAVAMADSDLARLRETEAFRTVRQRQLKLRPLSKEGKEGKEGKAGNQSLALQAEARAPFRPVRLVFYLALGTAAALAAFVTVPRVIIAAQGSEDISLVETLKNLAIDIGGIIAFTLLFRWDLSKNQETLETVSRENNLSKLKVELKTGKKVAVGQLQERYRPVILYGDSKTLEEAEADARKYLKDLTERGVILIKVPRNEDDGSPSEKALRGFGKDVAKKEQPKTEDEEIASVVAASMESATVKFTAEAANMDAWRSFLEQELGSKDISAAYIFLRLDGRIRSSGKSVPNWASIVNEVPKTSDGLSKVVQ